MADPVNEPTPKQIDAAAQAIRVQNPVGAAQTAEVALRAALAASSGHAHCWHPWINHNGFRSEDCCKCGAHRDVLCPICQEPQRADGCLNHLVHAAVSRSRSMDQPV